MTVCLKGVPQCFGYRQRSMDIDDRAEHYVCGGCTLFTLLSVAWLLAKSVWSELSY